MVLSPQTGQLHLLNLDNNKLLHPLLRGPELIEWLSDIELSMAKEAKPHETIEGISEQLANLQVNNLRSTLYSIHHWKIHCTFFVDGSEKFGLVFLLQKCVANC